MVNDWEIPFRRVLAHGWILAFTRNDGRDEESVGVGLYFAWCDQDIGYILAMNISIKSVNSFHVVDLFQNQPNAGFENKWCENNTIYFRTFLSLSICSISSIVNSALVALPIMPPV